MCEHARTSKCVGCAWPMREKLSLGAREKFKCLQNKINKMNLPKNAVLFVALLLSLRLFFICLSFVGKVNGKDECSVCGRKNSKRKAKTTERFYQGDSSSPKFSSCFGPVENCQPGILCIGCYRALNRYKTSGKTPARMSTQYSLKNKKTMVNVRLEF